jgi:hypothetical protein
VIAVFSCLGALWLKQETVAGPLQLTDIRAPWFLLFLCKTDCAHQGLTEFAQHHDKGTFSHPLTAVSPPYLDASVIYIYNKCRDTGCLILSFANSLHFCS